MSILARTSKWALLDQSANLNQQYHSVSGWPKGENHTYEYFKKGKPEELNFTKYEIKKELFAVHTPFMMESQARAVIQRADTSLNVKKRKRKSACGNSRSPEILKVVDVIKEVLSEIQTKGHNLQIFKHDDDALRKYDNNRAAQLAAATTGFGDIFQEMSSQQADTLLSMDKGSRRTESLNINGSGVRVTSEALIGRLVHSYPSGASLVEVGGHKCLMPEDASFLTCGYEQLAEGGFEQLKLTYAYDVIVMDPPWQNKMVKRKKGYWMFNESELLKLPLASMLAPHGLVCVWVTNRPGLVEYVTDTLFHAWEVEVEATWVWLKMAGVGEPVCDLDSSHKQCYELLVIGRKLRPKLAPFPDLSFGSTLVDTEDKDGNKMKNTQKSDSLDIVLNQTAKVDKKPSLKSIDADVLKSNFKSASGDGFIYEPVHSDENGCDDAVNDADDPEAVNWQKIHSLPPDFVFSSIPCAIHSKKPNISGIIEPYTVRKPNCLELFARNLNSGWTSWGNEPLRHQHIDFFEEKPNS